MNKELTAVEILDWAKQTKESHVHLDDEDT